MVKYPKWIANIILVPKKDGKVKMCVDYPDLNRISSKDDFPLLHIDVLIDNTIYHSRFSFIDVFFGYNQIKMALKDKEKIELIMLRGTLCYIVLPFELNDVGTTYQRALVILFHNMMHKKIKGYVGNMITKS